MSNPIQQLRAQGQSVWLDFIRRGIILSGELYKLVEERTVTGITSNPTIFRKAISGASDYEPGLRGLAHKEGITPYEAFLSIGGDDIRLAADILRQVYDETDGVDGYVSFEAQNGTPEEIVAEARKMFRLVDRPNVMIKVPGTPAGVAAVPELIAAGLNINITLLFDVAVYIKVAEAYIEGLERRLAAGQPLDKIASVASFFVSRVDTKADALLPEDSSLRGKVAVANARVAYGHFLELFSGPRWQRLADAGARVQRPLWASTGTKNPAYSDVLYVDELVAPHTVNTMPEATLEAFADHGSAIPAIDPPRITEAMETLAEATAAGLDLDEITRQLLEEGLHSFEADFEALLQEIETKLNELRSSPQLPPLQLAGLEAAVERRFGRLRDERVLERIWQGDHTVWKPSPAEITEPNRLGWLTVADRMTEEIPALRAFADGVRNDGIRHVLVLGMGGSSLAPEVFGRTFPANNGAPTLSTLDTTDPDAIAAAEHALDIGSTLFIVASKSGSTIETMSHFAYFWERTGNGRQFVAITDAGTPLAALAERHGFRATFLNPPEIGGRYSALSYFGLVPAAAAGVDLDALLWSAREAAGASHYRVPATVNRGAWLGAVIGEAALVGRDKLTLVLPDEIAALGDWIEQLIAESTGKEGKGIVPIAGEPLGPPDVYGNDRLFVALGDREGLDALEAAGQPVVRLHYKGRESLGGEFFRWEMATAIAGNILGINPFDQPDVQAAKDATARALATSADTAAGSDDAAALAGLVKPGDYVAIQAYLPRTDATDQRLLDLRLKLREQFKVATTAGYGPRYLHSTGQLHKGGPDSVVCIQLLGANANDLAVPEQSYSFGRLKRAQAQGDYETLKQRGRRVLRFMIGDDTAGELAGLIDRLG